MAPFIDIEASLERFSSQYAVPGIIKLPEDLDRYRAVIMATRPDLLIECGTWQGGSARWFAAQGLDVITIDIDAVDFGPAERITQITGDSASPAVATQVAIAARGRRTMVSLDSDHSAAHVADEIKLYGPLVSPGCHLVVEDGILRWIPTGMGSVPDSPMRTIEDLLQGNPRWKRDEETEKMHTISMHPAGWWIRRA